VIGVTPLQWLSTLIVRGAQVADLNLILNSIQSLGEWGEPNMLLVQQIWPGNTNLQVNPAAGTTGLPNYMFSRSYRLFGFFLPLDLGSHFNLKGVYRRFDKDYFEPFEDLFWNYLRLPVRHDFPWEQLPSSYIAGRLKMQDGEL
jgi:hypothetical protein